MSNAGRRHTPERWRSVKEGRAQPARSRSSLSPASPAPPASRRLLKSADFFTGLSGRRHSARHDWATENEAALTAFLGVYLRGLDWVLDPANRETAAAILAERMPEIQPKALDAVMRSLLSERSGLTPDGAILRDGARTVLDLRSKYGAGKTILTDVSAISISACASACTCRPAPEDRRIDFLTSLRTVGQPLRRKRTSG